MFKQIAKTFLIPGTNVYDLGCSTATTLINLCSEIEQPGHLIGYDNSLSILKQANQKIKEKELGNRIEVRHADLT
jgi:tRNA (cmo5U34)-methyltransferase